MALSLAELPPHTLEILIPENDVAERIGQIGVNTSRDYWKKNPVLVALLKGGATFDEGVVTAAKQDGLKFDRGSMGVSSYGKGTESNGHPVITQSLNVDVAGRDVVLDEDISDTGHTYAFVMPYILAQGAKSVKMNTLLWKPSRQVVPVELYQVGFTIPDKFVVGTGIDWQEYYREKLGIWVVNFATETG